MLVQVGDLFSRERKMRMNYVGWALVGMIGYSFTTLFVKLATRTGDLGAFAVLAIATSIVAVAALINAAFLGAFAEHTWRDASKPGALWAYAAGCTLTVAVGSLFKGLSLGPASVVVPIYGMFIVGGALLGIIFLGETPTVTRVIGLLMAAGAVYFISR